MPQRTVDLPLDPASLLGFQELMRQYNEVLEALNSTLQARVKQAGLSVPEGVQVGWRIEGDKLLITLPEPAVDAPMPPTPASSKKRK